MSPLSASKIISQEPLMIRDAKWVKLVKQVPPLLVFVLNLYSS